MKKACKNCKMIYEGNECPNCHTKEFVDTWKGRVIIFNTEGSEIAKKLKLNKKGVYAIKTK